MGSFGTLECCWGGRQGGCGPESCVRQLRVCGSHAGCVSCELVCVCVSLVRVVIICPASTHTALVSSPSLTVVHLSTYSTYIHKQKRWCRVRAPAPIFVFVLSSRGQPGRACTNSFVYRKEAYTTPSTLGRRRPTGRVPTGPKKRKEKRNGPPPIAALRVG